MINLNSARLREETAHSTNGSHSTNASRSNISDALKRRAQSVINDKSIDAQTRAIIRYGLEINDPELPELIRCADNGESILDNVYVASSEEKIEALTDLICKAGDEPSAALLVLLSTLENSSHPKALANRETLCLHPLRRIESPRHGRRPDRKTRRRPIPPQHFF